MTDIVGSSGVGESLVGGGSTQAADSASPWIATTRQSRVALAWNSNGLPAPALPATVYVKISGTWTVATVLSKSSLGWQAAQVKTVNY